MKDGANDTYNASFVPDSLHTHPKHSAHTATSPLLLFCFNRLTTRVMVLVALKAVTGMCMRVTLNIGNGMGTGCR